MFKPTSLANKTKLHKYDKLREMISGLSNLNSEGTKHVMTYLLTIITKDAVKEFLDFGFSYQMMDQIPRQIKLEILVEENMKRILSNRRKGDGRNVAISLGISIVKVRVVNNQCFY